MVRTPLKQKLILVGRTLSMVHRRRVQLINLGTMPVLLPRHPTLADIHTLYLIIASLRPSQGLGVVCTPFQAAIDQWDETQYKTLLEQLEVAIKDFSLPNGPWTSQVLLYTGPGQWLLASTNKTAFFTPLGLFKFTCMPVGLSNAPRTFQSLMK